MRKYDNYKDSGIEWIGEIPSHWEINKFGRATFFQEGPGLRNWQFTESGIKVICVTNIVPPYIDFSKMTKYISEEEYETTYKHFTVKKGDIMLASSGASWGKVAEYIEEETVILNTSTIRLNEAENKKVKKEFIKWVIQSAYINESLNILLTGSCQPNFGPTHLNKLTCVYPINVEEQIAIANYLDQKTNQIDDLIAKKERLIHLLNEERTAIINQAVTKGLDPNVPMKDSGIDWLGEIPAHWEVKKLKYIFDNLNSKRVPLSSEERGRMASRIYDYYGASGIIDQVDNYLFDGENILIGEDGANLLTRSKRLAFIASGKYWVNNHAHIIKPKTGNLNYFCELLELMDYSIWVTGSAQPKLTQEALTNIQIIEPPIGEQNLIAKHLDEKLSQINSIQEKYEQEIELLKEYKTALISEVVTGKVDVRKNVSNEKL